MPFNEEDQKVINNTYLNLKNICDLFFALILLILISPFLIIISILIKKNLGYPIFFTQKRSGLNGKIFKLIKFRSMSNQLDQNGNLLPDNERISKFGKWIRNTSIDELPNLFNILKGEISFIGPRPSLPEYFDLYNNEQKKRLSVKPGISGWAQVKGRNKISWEEKFELDLWYIKNISFFLDTKILVLTLYSVITKNGSTNADGTTMPFFKGNKP